MSIRLLALGLVITLFSLRAQTGDAWKSLDFLLGNWIGTASAHETPHGAGQGEYSFKPELDHKIIVRRNNANYDSGVRHSDLMVIYLDSPDAAPRAIYFDTEGHVIRYNLAFPSANRVVFESEKDAPGPRYRLTYWLAGGLLNGRFETAPPQGEYKMYLSWTSKRRQ